MCEWEAADFLETQMMWRVSGPIGFMTNMSGRVPRCFLQRMHHPHKPRSIFLWSTYGGAGGVGEGRAGGQWVMASLRPTSSCSILHRPRSPAVTTRRVHHSPPQSGHTPPSPPNEHTHTHTHKLTFLKSPKDGVQCSILCRITEKNLICLKFIFTYYSTDLTLLFFSTQTLRTVMARQHCTYW